MKFKSWFSRVSKQLRKRPARVRAARKLDLLQVGLEELEARNLPSVLPPVIVDQSASSIGNVSFAGGSIPAAPAINGENTLGIGISPSTAIDPLNPQKLITVASTGTNAFRGGPGFTLLATSNGGATWTAETMLEQSNLVDPTLLGVSPDVYANNTDATVSWDRTEQFYVVVDEHKADYSSGAIVLYKFNFGPGLTDPVLDTLTPATDPQTGRANPESPGKILYHWLGSDAAYNPTVAVDTNVPSYTDPQTGDVQTDTLATTVATATGAATLNATGGVSGVTLTSAGSGYGVPPTVTFTTMPGDTGAGAKAHALISNGVVIGIVMDKPGNGYTVPPLVSLSPNGPTAQGFATINAGGGVAKITVTTAGAYYTTPPIVTITAALGDTGIGATATVTVDANGFVNGVTITNPGTGYLVAPTVTFTPSALPPSPKAIYVAWNTVNNAPTNTDPRFPGTPADWNGQVEPANPQAPGSFNPNLIKLMASADGGIDFTTPEDVNDPVDWTGAPEAAPDYGVKSSNPQIVFTQGNTSGTVPGGEMAIVWDNVTHFVNPNLSATGGGWIIDTSRPDSGLVSQPAASAYVVNGSLKATYPLDPFFAGGTGTIEDAQFPPTTGGGTSVPDIIEESSFPVNVNITDPNFSITDVSVSLAMYAPHMDQMQILLVAPDGTTVTLLNNYMNADGTVNDGPPGVRDTGLADVPNMGMLNNTQYKTYSTAQVVDTVFDQNAARAINDLSVTEPISGYFRPDDLGGEQFPGEPGTGLNVFQGFTPAMLNGTWHLEIFDYRNDRLPPNGMAQNFDQVLDHWKLNLTGYISNSQFGIDNEVDGPPPVAKGLWNPFTTIWPGQLSSLTGTVPANNDIPGSATAVYPDTQPSNPVSGIGPTFSVAVDNTLGSFSVFQGRLYIAATTPSLLEKTPVDDTDINIVYSDDGGVSWDGGPIRINDDIPSDGTEGNRPQFMPTLSVDPTTGTLVATYLDARNDAAKARVVTMVQTSIDGGNTWSQSTYLNVQQTATDAISGQADVVGAIPTNIGAASVSDGVLGVGDRGGLVVYGGKIYAFWSGNLNTAGTTAGGINTGGFIVTTARATIAGGPRVISGDQGPITAVGTTGSYNNLFSSDGTRELTAFEVQLDRPVDPATLNSTSLQVNYRDPNTPASQPGTNLTGQITSITPLNPDTTSNPPAISIGNAIVVDPATAGGTVTALFPVLLTVPQAIPVTLTVTTADITARLNVDYTAPAAMVTIPAGATSGTVTVTVLHDPLLTGNETFAVNLSNAPTGIALKQGTGIGTIVSSAAPYTLSVSDGIAFQPLPNSPAVAMVFQVLLNQPFLNNVSITYSTADGTARQGVNYVPVTNGLVTIPAGKTSATILIPLLATSAFGPNLNFFLNLGTAPVGFTVGRPQGTGTIVNDATLNPLSLDVGNAVANRGSNPTTTTNIYFPVVLSIAQTTAIVATYSTQDGSPTAQAGAALAGTDYIPTTGTLLFNPGQTTATITVQVKGTSLPEANLDFHVNLSYDFTLNTFDYVTSAYVPTTYTGTSQGTGLLLNNNFPPVVTVGNAIAQASTQTPVAIVFPVYLSYAVSQPVTFAYTTSDGTAISITDPGLVGPADYRGVPNPVVVTFAPGTTLTYITLQVLSDTQVATDKTFFLNLQNPVGLNIGTPQATGTIVDSPLGLSISNSSIANPNTGTATMTFTVNLNGPTTNTVTVNYTTMDSTVASNAAKAGTDYVPTSGTLTFTPGGPLTQTISVQVKGSYTQAAFNKVFLVDLNSSSYANIIQGQGQAVGVIVDTNAVPTLTVENVTVMAGDLGGTPTNALVTVHSSFPIPSDIKVAYSTADGTATTKPDALGNNDYTSESGTLTIPAGMTTAVVTVPITSLPSYEEPNLTFTVNLGKVSTLRADGTTPNAAVAAAPAGKPANYYGTGTVTIVHDGVSINIGNAYQPGTPTANDPAGEYAIVPPANTMPPTTNMAEFPVFLSGPRTLPVTVKWTTVPGSGKAGTDYGTAGSTAEVTGTLTFAPGTTQAVIDVPVLYTPTVASEATFSVQLAINPMSSHVDPRDGTVMGEPQVSLTSGQAIIFHLDGGSAMPALPVEIAIGGATYTKGGILVFPVVINQPADATVDFTVTNGSASNTTTPPQYTVLTTSPLTFSNTSQIQYIYVQTLQDNFDGQTVTGAAPPFNFGSGNRNFFITLGNPQPMGTTISKAFNKATGLIVDNDANTVTIASIAPDPDATAVKPQGDATCPTTTTAVFTVLLNNVSPTPVHVALNTQNLTALAPTDYIDFQDMLVTIPKGQLSQTFSVTVNGNTLQEGNTQYLVNVATSMAGTPPVIQYFITGASPAKVAASPPANVSISYTATIIDQNTIGLTIGDASGAVTGAGGTVLDFPVYLNAKTTNPVTVEFQTEDATAVSTGANPDYVATMGTLTIPAGSLSATISVTVNPQALEEGNRQFTVNLMCPQGAGFVTNVDTLNTGQAIGTIYDDNLLPALSIGDATVAKPTSGTTTVTFPVFLSNPVAEDITVPFSTADDPSTDDTGPGSEPDYVPTSGTVLIPHGTTTATITVTVNGDTLPEGNEPFLVNLSTPMMGSMPLATLARGTATGTIVDIAAPPNALPSLNVGDVIVDKTPSLPQTVVVPVLLSNPSPLNVTVNFTTSDGTAMAGVNYLQTSGSLTLPAGTVQAGITVTVLGNTIQEGTKFFNVNLSDAFASFLTRQQGEVEIVDGNGKFGASLYLVSIAPQSAVGTYSYAVGPYISDRIRTNVPTVTPVAGTNAIVYTPPASQVSVQVPTMPATGTEPLSHTNSTLTISGVPSNLVIRDMTVNLSVSYPIADHLLIDLVAPDGTTNVWLTANSPLPTAIVDPTHATNQASAPNDYANYFNTTFDSQAGQSIAQWNALPPFDGSYRPEVLSTDPFVPTFSFTPTPLVTSPFSIFNGLSPNGIWTLRVYAADPLTGASDPITAPQGLLTNWSMSVQYGVEQNTTSTQQAAGIATLTGGGVSSVAVVLGGAGYTAPPNVTLVTRPGDPGTGAVAHAVLTNGVVTSVVIDNAGSGYLQPPQVVFSGMGQLGNTMNQTSDGFTDNQTRNSLDIYSAPQPSNGVSYKLLPNPVVLPDGTGVTSTASNPFQLPYTSNTLPLIIPGPHSIPLAFFPSPNPGSLAPIPNPVPLNIPIVAATGTPTSPTPGVTTSQISITNVPAGQVISHLTVEVALRETQDSNLVLTLIAPDGTQVVLSNRNPEQIPSETTLLTYLPGENFDDVTFDDAAPATQILTPAQGQTAPSILPPYTGVFQPQSPLSVLNGKTLNGTWTLQIQDYGTTDIGALLGWSVGATNGEDLNVTTSSVDVRFSELIDPSTFLPTNILSIMGPAGPVPLINPSTGQSNITIVPLLPNGAIDSSLNPAPEHSFRIFFPTQNVSGNYSVQIGPNPVNQNYIESTSGNKVDQNLNAGLPALKGEDLSSNTTIPITTASNAAPNPQPPVKLVPGGPLALMPITVTNDFVIQGVKVTVNINTTYDQGLQGILFAPDGTEVTLFTQVGSGPVGGQSGFQNTTFDDAAATPIQEGVTPFNTPPGSYNPQKPLSILDGKASAGTWYLGILSYATVKVGSSTQPNTPGFLNNWSLTLLESPSTNTGLGEPVADQFTAPFQIFIADPTAPNSSTQWTPVGPGSINSQANAGRVTAITVDPSDPSGNTVYAAGASGGIWKTTNFMTSDPRGPNWIPLTDFGPTFSLNIGSLVVIPRNHDPLQSIIIAGTGEGNTLSPGVGFLRSEDGGQTWQVLDSTNNVDPATGQISTITSASRDHHFVGTTSYRLLADVPDAAKYPSSEIILYAAMGDTPTNSDGLPSSNFGGVYRSVDLGNTWQEIAGGDATDIQLAAGSVGANGNLQILYGAFKGIGVAYTPNATVAASMQLLPTPGPNPPPNTPQQDNLLQNDFNYPTVQILPVANPPTTPSGAPGGVTPEGRITLAVPQLTGQPLLDSFYQSWIYAAVATPGSGGTTFGLYLSKDFGREWTQILIPVRVVNGVQLFPTNDYTQPEYDPLAKAPWTQANYSISLAVDPSDPNILYVGGVDYTQSNGGLIRVDTTNLSDPYAFVPYENTKNDGGQQLINTVGSALKYDVTPDKDPDFGVADPYTLPPYVNAATTFEQYTGENPTTDTGGYYNLQRNPQDPFITFSTVRTYGIGTPNAPAHITQAFTNTGQGAKWISDEPGMTGIAALNASYFQILAMPDTLTGTTRLILGTSLGVYTQVADNSAALVPGIGFESEINGARNGNIQITQFFGGTSQPSELAAELAGSMFYGAAREEGEPDSTGNVLQTGNVVYSGATGDAASVGVDQTGSGTKYEYLWPTFFLQPGQATVGGLPSDFFQVTPPGGASFSATNGLVVGTTDPSTNTGQWPLPAFPVGSSYVQPPGGANLVVNPVDGKGILLGSPGIPGQGGTTGWVYLTTTGGQNWFAIAQPTDLDQTYAQALAFGAPQPSAPPGTLDNFIYAGTTGGNIFVTTTAGGVAGGAWTNITGGAFGSAGALDGSAVQEIIPDPNRGSHDLYAVTLNGVYFMADSSALNPTWVNITGNLFTTALSRPLFDNGTQPNTLVDLAGARTYLSTLAVDWRFAIPNSASAPNGPTHPVLYVGGEAGVFRSLDQGKTWTVYPNIATDGAPVNGGYLPNAHVTDLTLALGNIDPSSGLPLDNTPTTQGTGFNMLVATTYGRGQFEIRIDENAQIFGQPISNFLVKTEKVEGPYVVSASLVQTTGAVSAINVTFSGAVDPSTFTLSRILQLTGPAGNSITPTVILDISSGGAGGNLHNVYQIQFPPQTAIGVYTLTLHHSISDFGGNQMDQNRNLINGENSGDNYTGSFFFGTVPPATTPPPVTEVVTRIQNNGQWWVGTPNGTNGLTFTQFGQWAVESPSLTWVDVGTGDFLGNGQQDLIGMIAQTGQWWVSVSSGDHFTNELWAVWAPQTAAFQWQNVVFGDFNGDGKTDIAGRESGTGKWWVGISNGHNFSTSAWTTWAPQSAGVTWTDVLVGDFNGDGKQDIAGRYLQTGQWWVAQSTGTSFVNSLWTTWSPQATWVDVQTGDFNGDGKTDIVGRYLQAGQWWVAESTGKAFSNVLWDTWSPGVTWVDVKVADLNGDGLSEIIGLAQGAGSWWVSSNQKTHGSTTQWGYWGADALGNINWEQDVVLADLNGDGKLDLVAWDQALQQWWVSLAYPIGNVLTPRSIWALWPGTTSFNLVNTTAAHVR